MGPDPVACAGGLKDLPEAVEYLYPDAEVRLCIGIVCYYK